MYLKLFQSKNGWRVSLRFHNGRTFATTEAYSSQGTALQAAHRVRRASLGMIQIRG